MAETTLASLDDKTVGEVVRKQENEYIRGNTTLSKYVTHSMYDTISRIDAYLNSKHISGEKDSKGRMKPFINIVVAMSNIWYRATDIDRKNIKLWARSRTQFINSLFANIILQDWMKRENFGQFLNDWGRTQSRYNSAAIKFVENSSGLHISVTPWNRLIVDPVDMNAAPVIEVLELSESQLVERIETHGYEEDQVKALINAKRTRETLNKQQKDSKNDYYKLYEVSGRMPSRYLEDGKDGYEWQMHTISFVGGRDNRGNKEYDDFTLVKGPLSGNPYMLTHLIKEEGRTLAIGPVEYLFDAQWLQNHSAKSIKDQLDLASKILFQTGDPQFLGRNFLDSLDSGDTLIWDMTKGDAGRITKVDNSSHDIVSWQNFALQVKELGRETVGISESMLGIQPKSGTAWRLQEAVLNESHSLFELMTENRGLDLEHMLRTRILPYLFKKYNNADEIATLLEKNDLEKIDQMFIRSEARRKVNEKIFQNLESIVREDNVEPITPEGRDQMIAEEEQALQDQLRELGNQRFIKPSDVTWKKQFEGVEWDIEVDITSEAHNMAEIAQTFNTALKVTMDPNFAQNPQAQAIIGKLFEVTGAMSPVEYQSIPQVKPQIPQANQPQLPVNQQQNA